MKTSCWSLPAACLLFGVFASETTLADGLRRAPIPEQILTETVTDIDATDPGETEVVLNAQTLRARSGGARLLMGMLEVEWRALRDVGLRVEPSYAATQDAAGARDQSAGLNAAASYALFHEWSRDIHLQAEAGARIAGSEPVTISVPGDIALPFTLGVRSAFRSGDWSLRPAVGVEAGGTPAHAPLWTGAGLLYALGGGGRYGFAGIELDADGARRAPFIVAADFMVDTIAAHLPFRVGIAVPYVVGAPAAQPQIGIYLRLMARTELD